MPSTLELDSGHSDEWRSRPTCRLTLELQRAVSLLRSGRWGATRTRRAPFDAESELPLGVRLAEHAGNRVSCRPPAASEHPEAPHRQEKDNEERYGYDDQPRGAASAVASITRHQSFTKRSMLHGGVTSRRAASSRAAARVLKRPTSLPSLIRVQPRGKTRGWFTTT